MEENKKIVYSALKPTGDLQLGNYIGALRNMVKMQDEYNCVYMVADLHSLTVSNLPADLRRRTYDFMALFLAIGLDPEKCVLAVQSHVPEHSELGWILNCYTMFGEASRMTQFKDKSLKNPDNVNVGLFAYPMLMAADILLYQTDLVPIGKDQKQHVEIARTIAERFNNKYSPTFVVPDCYFPKTGAKIQNLLDPTAKMGKTDDNTNGVVFLLDDKDTIARKFKRAVTDSGNEIIVSPEKPGISNRASIAFQSETDRDEAVLVGGEAARAALAGENGVMVGLRRVPGPVYQVETFLIPVEQVMLYERKMPDEYISADGCDVTDAFVEWCRPLIGSPLRQFVTFKPTL